MNRKLFASLVARRIHPVLRTQGYKGSGATLRRIAEPVVEVFNLQGSSGGNGCYFNLGLHLTFLPSAGGVEPEASALKEGQCAFRSRIEPPANRSFNWAYGRDIDEAQAQVERVLLEWDRQAKPFFEAHAYPAGLLRKLADLNVAEVHPAHLLTFAHIARQLGRRERALHIAQAALERVSASASMLRAQLVEFIAQA